MGDHAIVWSFHRRPCQRSAVLRVLLFERRAGFDDPKYEQRLRVNLGSIWDLFVRERRSKQPIDLEQLE